MEKLTGKNYWNLTPEQRKKHKEWFPVSKTKQLYFHINFATYKITYAALRNHLPHRLYPGYNATHRPFRSDCAAKAQDEERTRIPLPRHQRCHVAFWKYRVPF